MSASSRINEITKDLKEQNEKYIDELRSDKPAMLRQLEDEFISVYQSLARIKAVAEYIERVNDDSGDRDPAANAAQAVYIAVYQAQSYTHRAQSFWEDLLP